MYGNFLYFNAGYAKWKNMLSMYVTRIEIAIAKVNNGRIFIRTNCIGD